MAGAWICSLSWVSFPFLVLLQFVPISQHGLHHPLALLAQPASLVQFDSTGSVFTGGPASTNIQSPAGDGSVRLALPYTRGTRGCERVFLKDVTTCYAFSVAIMTTFLRPPHLEVRLYLSSSVAMLASH
jgi:hypothetical protein